jgi:hypothetical protein
MAGSDSRLRTSSPVALRPRDVKLTMPLVKEHGVSAEKVRDALGKAHAHH